MEYNTPLGASLIDKERLIGKPLDRVDGKLKVEGRAKYSYEYLGAGKTAYGVLLTAACGRGKVAFIDTAATEAAAGVLLVWTYKNAPLQADPSPVTLPQLHSANISHNGEAIAVVVAETFEQARAAALLIDVQYETADGAYNFTALIGTALRPPEGVFKPDTKAGDFEANFPASPVQVDVTYTTPDQSHAMMEPHGPTRAMR